MSKNKEIGVLGEKIAANYLAAKNHRLLCSNYRSGRNEIDIISEYNNTLVFVEVKTRKGSSFGHPELAVDEAKIARIQACAEDYIFEKNWEGKIRFDIISIKLDGDEHEIFHVEDAF